MNIKFLRKISKQVVKAAEDYSGLTVCPHCDGTGIEPTSAYPPEPCSVCYGHPLIPFALLSTSTREGGDAT